ncbi:MAG: hypothetical protein HFG39_16330 [Lachnospiraceae bacterium]|nr:hypothetical protein [Lachnospiraceae bacterium]
MKFIKTSAMLMALIIGFFAVDFTTTASNLSEAKPIVQKNEYNESYGSALFSTEELDLIKAQATNGKIGYVRSSELNGVSPSNPQEALNIIDEQRTIPVYESDGITIVGEFIIKSENAVPPTLSRTIEASGTKTYTSLGSGILYHNQATVSINNNNSSYQSVQSRVLASADRTVSSGWLGVFPQLYNSYGILVASGGYTYNSSPCISIEVPATYRTSSGAYYAFGYTRYWDNTTNSYVTRTASFSPVAQF